MPTITTKDGVEIFYKDWGAGQPIVFSHGWPLSADDWDAQMLFFVKHGYRVIAHDRRGHGRSTQVGVGHDMDHYADDLAALTTHLNLMNAVHVGHSTGGGEVVRYLARHGGGHVAKAAIISAVPPLMVQTEANPGGLPKAVFDDFQAQVATNRAQFYLDVASGPFYGFNRPGATPSQGVIRNWWRQGALRRHRRLFPDRLHRGPESDHGAGAGDARRRRPDRALCRLGAAIGEASEERRPEDLRRFPARHADHRGRDDQRRSSGLHQELGVGRRAGIHRLPLS